MRKSRKQSLSFYLVLVSYTFHWLTLFVWADFFVRNLVFYVMSSAPTHTPWLRIIEPFHLHRSDGQHPFSGSFTSSFFGVIDKGWCAPRIPVRTMTEEVARDQKFCPCVDWLLGAFTRTPLTLKFARPGRWVSVSIVLLMVCPFTFYVSQYNVYYATYVYSMYYLTASNIPNSNCRIKQRGPCVNLSSTYQWRGSPTNQLNRFWPKNNTKSSPNPASTKN